MGRETIIKVKHISKIREQFLNRQDQVYAIFIGQVVELTELLGLEVGVAAKVVVDPVNGALPFPAFVTYVVLEQFRKRVK